MSSTESNLEPGTIFILLKNVFNSSPNFIAFSCSVNATLNKDIAPTDFELAVFTGNEYDEFLDLFINAVKRRWPNVLLQFEDFAQPNAMPLLKLALTDKTDDIRLLAYAVIEKIEFNINRRISLLKKKLQRKASAETLQRVAESYWELCYLGIAIWHQKIGC